MLRLVSHEPAPTPSFSEQPTLRVIDWTPAPDADAHAWRKDEAGNYLPRTHRFSRVTLSRHQATKRWRELADEFDKATDALANTEYSDDAIAQWRTVAVRVIGAPWANSLENNLHNLRTRIALAALMAGERFEYGGRHGDDSYGTRAECAFAALDKITFGLLRKHIGQ